MLHSLFSAVLLFLLSQLAHAAPTPVELIAFSPRITSPSTGSVWNAGQPETVSWETDNVPAEAQNYTISVLLGYVIPGSNSEHLDTEHPLVTQVPIMQGTTTVVPPSNTTSNTNYVVALIGDSGNISPQFTILSEF